MPGYARGTITWRDKEEIGEGGCSRGTFRDDFVELKDDVLWRDARLSGIRYNSHDLRSCHVSRPARRHSGRSARDGENADGD
jgi:hypothetical protein